MNDRNWKKEFRSFLRAKEEDVSPATHSAVLSKVRTDLNPSRVSVLLHFLVIEFIAGALSLAVCPQLGVGPIGGGHGIMAPLMSLGSQACAVFCGAFLLGLSQALAVWLLRPEQIRVATAMGLSMILFLVAAGFGVLMLAGGADSMDSYGFWVLGAVITGFVVLRSGARLRGLSFAR